MILFVLTPHFVFAQANSLATKFSGKILLQVESYGRAWYVDPVSKTRFYLKDGETALDVMKTLGLGISNKDLMKIPVKAGEKSDTKLVNSLKGRILLAVEDRGKAWYLNPTNGLRYYLKNGDSAYEVMKTLSVGIKNKDLDTISVTPKQIVSGYTFDNVAYTLYQKGKNTDFSSGDTVLPLASLSKLMTAIVFLETKPDLEKRVKITEEEIIYPKKYVGDDITSEIDMKAGDWISMQDLLTSLLVASSNQASIVLVNSSGLTQSEFIEKMNQKVKDLGLIKTVFFEVSGLDAHNVSTAKEFAVIAKEAFAKPELLEIAKKNDYTLLLHNDLLGSREVPVKNRNYSLLEFSPEISKTGYLVEAQRNVALQKNGKIIVVLHSKSMSERNDIIKKLLAK